MLKLSFSKKTGMTTHVYSAVEQISGLILECCYLELWNATTLS